MSDLIPAAQFAQLFLQGTPLLDVRAPIEYQRGAFPNAVNIALLDDEQREAIGIRYKQAGQAAAVELGHELINGATKDQRLTDWREFIGMHANPALYCFRGGMRSQIVQQWLADAGIAIPRIAGGYKALRRFLIDTLETAIDRYDFIIVAGQTGSGKTHLLAQLHHHIDLEGQANHRGSAFGPRLGGQPSQIDFENRLAIDFLHINQSTPRHVFLEDESSAIGSLSLPRPLISRMRESPLAVLEVSFAERTETILNDYILANLNDWQTHSPDDALEQFAHYLRTSMGKIRRRLGADGFARVSSLLESALTTQINTGSVDEHRHWIDELLRHYYDPMYNYQLGKKLSRIIFRGNANEFIAWASHLSEPNK